MGLAITDLGREVMVIRIFLCSKLGSHTGQLNGYVPKCHASPSGMAEGIQCKYHILYSAQKN